MNYKNKELAEYITSLRKQDDPLIQDVLRNLDWHEHING